MITMVPAAPPPSGAAGGSRGSPNDPVIAGSGVCSSAWGFSTGAGTSSTAEVSEDQVNGSQGLVSRWPQLSADSWLSAARSRLSSSESWLCACSSRFSASGSWLSAAGSSVSVGGSVPPEAGSAACHWYSVATGSSVALPVDSLASADSCHAPDAASGSTSASGAATPAASTESWTGSDASSTCLPSVLAVGSSPKSIERIDWRASGFGSALASTTGSTAGTLPGGGGPKSRAR